MSKSLKHEVIKHFKDGLIFDVYDKIKINHHTKGIKVGTRFGISRKVDRNVSIVVYNEIVLVKLNVRDKLLGLHSGSNNEKNN